jgi:sulfite reductase (NADPH) flavoprotein alpha-component
MSASALLPNSAPFGDDERAQLDRVLAPASAIQRAWLAGFLAGLDASAPSPLAAPRGRAAEPLTILFASESGNAERLAHDTAKLARKAGFKPLVTDFADLDIASLAGAKRLVVIASTWGEGEPPGRAARAYAALMADGAPRLDGVSFAVLALGDTAYAEFCAVGRAIDERLVALGGTRATERIDCDLDFEGPATAWIKTTLETLAPPREEADNVVSVDFSTRSSAETSREPLIAEVTEHVVLSSSRSDKEVLHVALGFETGAPAYEPGDSLELFPENDPALVDEILKATGLTGDEGLGRKLIAERDITTLSVPTIERFAGLTGHAGAAALVAEGARGWTEGRQLVDLLAAFPASLAADDLLALTRPLPPRAYSIASSRKEVGDEAHLLIAAVRYESHGRARNGVASTHAADRLRAGSAVKVRVKPNRHFRLPDPAGDIIMVGPGTGIAPFRAFVQERRAVGATGRNWLFFGDRHYTHDFLYQLEWQEALADGSLHRLDLAFSRDAPEKVYVQHRLWEQRRDLVDWLERGARLYVCGDAKAMAKDVRATLVHLFADVKAFDPERAEAAIADLEREKRYLQDVY